MLKGNHAFLHYCCSERYFRSCKLKRAGPCPRQKFPRRQKDVRYCEVIGCSYSTFFRYRMNEHIRDAHGEQSYILLILIFIYISIHVHIKFS